MKNYRNKFIIIAGPCVIEEEKRTLAIAQQLKSITDAYPVHFMFKASFDKANRTSLRSFRGPGIKKGLRILEKVKKKLNVPLVSDVHCRSQVKEVKDILDVIQIPAFLSRQTDLIIEAAKTKKCINVKKAQIMAPEDMGYVVEKIESTGNRSIFLTERGTSFGYHNLVVDFRSIMTMRQFGYPVIFDATHALQRPSGSKGVSGGDREFVSSLALAACACRCDGLFLEVHPQPAKALSDRATSFALGKLEKLIVQALKVRKVIDEKV